MYPHTYTGEHYFIHLASNFKACDNRERSVAVGSRFSLRNREKL